MAAMSFFSSENSSQMASIGIIAALKFAMWDFTYEITWRLDEPLAQYLGGRTARANISARSQYARKSLSCQSEDAILT